MTKVRKCHICGKELHDITKKGFEYSPLFKNAAGNYHLCGRMKLDDGLGIMLSKQDDYSKSYSKAFPVCAECFKKKLKRFIVAMEIALENKGIKVDDDAPEADQKPEEPKAPEITAEEVRRDYPEWCAKLKAANKDREVDDGTLLEIFLKHRKHGMV